MNDEQRAILKRLYRERRASGVWPVNRAGKLTKAGRDMALDWIVGACAGCVALGNPDAAPTGLAFLASVRDADEIMLKD